MPPLSRLLLALLALLALLVSGCAHHTLTFDRAAFHQSRLGAEEIRLARSLILKQERNQLPPGEKLVVTTIEPLPTPPGEAAGKRLHERWDLQAGDSHFSYQVSITRDSRGWSFIDLKPVPLP